MGTRGTRNGRWVSPMVVCARILRGVAERAEHLLCRSAGRVGIALALSVLLLSGTLGQPAQVGFGGVQGPYAVPAQGKPHHVDPRSGTKSVIHLPPAPKLPPFTPLAQRPPMSHGFVPPRERTSHDRWRRAHTTDASAEQGWRRIPLRPADSCPSTSGHGHFRSTPDNSPHFRSRPTRSTCNLPRSLLTLGIDLMHNLEHVFLSSLN
jgi:hypothetical protein